MKTVFSNQQGDELMQVVTVYTIGHSNRTIDDFILALQSAGIQALVDIRIHPTSQRNPQFNEAALRAAMEQHAIIYHWAGRQLGGKRPASDDSVNIALEENMRGFADYMQTTQFQRAASQIVSLTAKSNTALMCAEADPLQCHRSLIADYLLLQGHRVIHIIDKDTQTEHQLHPAARRESAELIYDRHVTSELPL